MSSGREGLVLWRGGGLERWGVCTWYGGAKGGEAQGEAHDEQPRDGRVAGLSRVAPVQAHDERGVEVHDAHGAGADHGGVAGAGEGLVGAVVGLEDAEGVAEAWVGGG